MYNYLKNCIITWIILYTHILEYCQKCSLCLLSNVLQRIHSPCQIFIYLWRSQCMHFTVFFRNSTDLKFSTRKTYNHTSSQLTLLPMYVLQNYVWKTVIIWIRVNWYEFDNFLEKYLMSFTENYFWLCFRSLASKFHWQLIQLVWGKVLYWDLGRKQMRLKQKLKNLNIFFKNF